MKPFYASIGFAILWMGGVALVGCRAEANTPESAPPNVLLIVIDDLRPELGCYGSRHIHSPNIDNFAAGGRRFERAYCQQAVCNPSRTSFMTGLRPDSIGVTGNHVHFRSRRRDVVTLPQYFQRHGYHAQSIGKIYHGVFPDGASKTKWDTMGDPPSWSVPTTRFGPRYYFTESGIDQARRAYRRMYDPKNQSPEQWTSKLVFGPMTEAPLVEDDVLYDGKVGEEAVATLAELKQAATPFFLAVGFIKPHSPFVAPRKYWDLYDPNKIELAADASLPAGAPAIAGHRSGEIRRYTDQPARGEFSSDNQRRLKHGYYACISFIDAQIGRLLDALRQEALEENTIVVLISDHGYHLGEHGLWGKTTNFELDTRVPMVIRVPGMQHPGRPSKQIAELVDLYPTLAQLAGLPIPDHVQGTSLARQIATGETASSAEENIAVSQYPRGGNADSGGAVMGYSIRTDRWRYNEWINRKTLKAVARELYDHAADTGETENVVDEQSLALVVDELSQRLREQVLPPRPNVLLIVGEDHGCELSCYGDPVVETPHIDQLAAGGILFDSGYVTQSVCSPSRSTIFTGLYPHQNGQLGLATHQFGWFERFPTTYSLLKTAGYRTGLIGKTHVIPAGAVESFVDFRFQEKSNFAKRNVADYASQAGQFFRAGDEPFFMTVNYPDAHWPLQGRVDGLPETRVDPAKVRVMPYVGDETPRLREIAQNYYDCMLRLDACVGQLLEQLEQSGKADNTLVIFIGDHGAQMARGKVTVYEGGVRVPFIARWPGVIRPGGRSRALVSTTDLLPTMLDVAKVAAVRGLPGKSLRPIFEETIDEKAFRSYLFCERNCDAAHITCPQRTIRDHRFKLIHSPVRDREDPAARYYRIHGATHWSGCLTDEELRGASQRTRQGYARWLNPPEFQLYDLQDDPHEWTDLADDPKHAETIARLQKRLRQWQRDTRDYLLEPKKLQRLMDETDLLNREKRRSPKGGWKYLEYLAPKSGTQAVQ